ncbi:duplicated homeodomain-like superfamily protein [Striga asiatica]|uniref:Duplicated homeodomain-like superfamily protein n=1 Tax=Striga asiatica TaxID=4170 RepID=A0A5A7NXT7_STRAF|nr:duplicated homeodomain-like superfamily protein [Striga asiatica]
MNNEGTDVDLEKRRLMSQLHQCFYLRNIIPSFFLWRLCNYHSLSSYFLSPYSPPSPSHTSRCLRLSPSSTPPKPWPARGTPPCPSPSSSSPPSCPSPPDSSFSAYGKPSLTHLLLHFFPPSLSLSSLLSLPFASTVPSLSPASHLVVTSGQPVQISINKRN